MYNQMSRYDIHFGDEDEPMKLDFILNRSQKKIVHGTVWNDDLSDPQPEKDALVLIYLPGKNYTEDPQDLINIGYAVTDKMGEFIAGPFSAESEVILKICKMNKLHANLDGENSYSTNTLSFE